MTGESILGPVLGVGGLLGAWAPRLTEQASNAPCLPARGGARQPNVLMAIWLKLLLWQTCVIYPKTNRVPLVVLEALRLSILHSTWHCHILQAAVDVLMLHMDHGMFHLFMTLRILTLV